MKRTRRVILKIRRRSPMNEAQEYLLSILEGETMLKEGAKRDKGTN